MSKKHEKPESFRKPPKHSGPGGPGGPGRLHEKPKDFKGTIKKKRGIKE